MQTLSISNRSYFTDYKAVLELFKLRLVPMVLITTFGGMWLAPAVLHLGPSLLTLSLVLMLVAGANAINMFLERESDALMNRTKSRPLPTDRVQPNFSLVVGLSLSILAIILFFVLINPLTASLALLSFVLYVAVYTPLKVKTPIALWVGAIPGAMPAILGWTAVTNQIGNVALTLFAILYIWQIPHFLAITLFRKNEYTQAGFVVLPATQGERSTMYQMIQYTFVLLPVTLLVTPLGLTGLFYFFAALILGLSFFGIALMGLKRYDDPRWAKQYFFASIIYLPLLYLALVLDRIYFQL